MKLLLNSTKELRACTLSRNYFGSYSNNPKNEFNNSVELNNLKNEMKTISRGMSQKA